MPEHGPHPDRLGDLLPGIVWFVSEIGGWIHKTKLLKYLYLLDVEHYRSYGSTHTGLLWISYKFGPWTSDYDPLLQGLATRGLIVETERARDDTQACFLRPGIHVGLDRLFDSATDQVRAERILRTWASESVGPMLDYVYFYTEPMADARWKAPLDFSRISRQETRDPRQLLPSGADPAELRRKRRALAALLDSESRPRAEGPLAPAPRYDEAFLDFEARLGRNPAR